MMVENLLEGLSGNERKDMIVEELDTLTDKQVLGLVTSLMAESLTEENRKDVMSGVLVELSHREREETAVDIMHLSHNKSQRQMILKLMINAMPEKEQAEFNKLMEGLKKPRKLALGLAMIFQNHPKVENRVGARAAQRCERNV